MTICPSEKCFGCGLCVAVCPVKCISLIENVHGELHPSTDEEKCISCGLCQKKCPVNSPQELRYPLEYYAASKQDSIPTDGSSSAGVASLLAALFPGRAFGTSWSQNQEAIVKCGEPEEFKGSKYVQSVIAPEVFRDISKLSDNSDTIFIGTPCQVAAVKSFVKNGEHLFTADLLCHGVCPPSYLKDELKPLLERFPQTTKVSFRDGNIFRLALEDSKGNILYSCPAQKQHYFRAFLEGVSLRENCYSCPFANKERVSDITLGDFIVRKGQVSWVSVNSEKGQTLFKSIIEQHPELHVESCEYEERLAYPYSLLKPFPKSDYRTKFLRAFEKKGYLFAIRKIVRIWRVRDTTKIFYQKIHHAAHLVKKFISKPLSNAKS